ncbi:Hypothetical Protein FCC1311_054052 [Hondaea fermentalgiana]|uniref:Ternary complex associated domain-containing protein n=1 Tax=Hondaea fermentalgiana TaxID=2315210 RepID=A0A2R5GKN5_9STRA|nr:Hypothetical Protein FCC1311_054052 [Hondaea fermentalgiana]|eukprot:GBG29183.1 Hypothetical Protein FCC1311_054052 [Hondaea fermentalgiana]
MGGSAPEEGPRAGPVEPRDCGHGRQRRLGTRVGTETEADTSPSTQSINEAAYKETEILDDTSFQDLSEFRTWLHESGIDTLHWGLARTKSSASLFREIQNKTSVLVIEAADGDSFRIFRLLRVVRVRVKQEIERGRIRYLVEASQELGETGQLRYRNMLLSSMMRYGENAFNAARRSVEKEMQNINTVRGRCIPRRAITAKRDSPRVCVEDLESPSYPGLLTRYILVTVDVALDRRLPDADFCTVEYLPTMHIATKHYWKWRTRAEVAQIVNGKTSRSAPSTAHRRNLLLGDATESTSALLPGTEKPFFWSLYDDDFEKASDSDDLFIPFSRLRRHMRQWGLTEDEIADLLQQIKDVLRDESLLSKSDFKKKLADPITELIVADQDSLSSRGLGNEHYQVLKNLFPNASRIFSRILHGGFSGSFVLQAQARYCDGLQGDPTVVKLDRRDLMRDEIQRFRTLAPYMGDCAPAILQTDVEGSDSLLGGIKFELVGAVWMLPDFRSNLLNSGAAQPLSTFKKLFMHESAEEERARVEHALGKARVSSSHVLASHTSDKFPTMQTETQVARPPSSPASISSPMTGPMSPTSEDEEPRSALDPGSPKEVSKGTNLVYGEVYQVLKEVFGEIMRTTTLSSKETVSCSLLDVYRIDKYIGRLLEPPAAPGLTGAGAAGLPDWAQLDPTGSGRALLQRLLDKIDRQTYPYEMGLVHGDLNGMNILIDSHNIVWVIDFAFSGRGHVLTDIAKLESCVLFEYTQPRSNAEYEALQEVADILIQVGDLREVVFNSRFDMQTDAAPTEQLARVAFAWKAIKRLRMYAANYCDTDPGPAQMLVAMLHNAARALRFTDIEDKRLPYFVATRCAQRLLDFMETNRGSIKIPARAHSEAASRHKPMNASLSADQIKYEKHRYFHDVRVRESYILDLFTREPVNILEQTVELQMIEGSSREKVMREVANMDEIQAQRRLRKRLDALRGDILGCTADEGLGGSWPASAVNDEDNGHARFTSALQVLGNPRDEGHRVLLGGAASGKSCLMRKILVSMGHDLASDGHDVIPILILIIELGRLMTERKLTSEDDLLDAYFASTFGEGSARLAFFRQMRKEDALCYLFDGLDEAGDHKPAIERYLAGLVDHEKRIIISSRETGFNETAFRNFQFLQVMPLTDQMQSQIVEMRLGSDHPRLLTIRNELRKPQYAEIARNPLMLSLLVSLLANKANSASQSANGERPRSNQGILTRSYLYERAVAQLLHHGSMAKFGMRRGADDKHVQRSIEALASKISYGFLKSLAFTAQSLRTRDFGPDVLNRVAETYVADPIYFSPEVMAKPLALQEEVFRVIEVLQGAVYSGLCGLFATSRVSVQPNAAAEGYGSTTSQTSPQQVLRFVHLSFQEYLAGLFIVDHLQRALRSTKDGGENPFGETIKSLLCICPEQEEWGHLHDPWWQVTLASMAGSMPPRTFLAFAECILSWDDSSGSNVLLCAELHAEAAASESLEGARDVGAEAPRSQVEALIKSRFSDYINEEELVDALTHPSRNLQLMALAEVHKLYDSRKAAYSIMFGPGIDETTDRAPLLLLPWYRRASAAYALSHLASAKNDEVIIDVLLGLWSDESGQVRRAAVEAIAALQAESHKLVIDELHRQLHDEVESENGHELVAALRVQHPRIIEDLLTIASLDESGASSSISNNSHEALLSLPLTVELLYTLCRAVSHAKVLSVRSCAARILISRCAPEAGDEAAPLNETLETAFISWLEHPEVTFCMSAAQILAQSTFKSFRIAQALSTLQKRVASLPGDHSDLWDAALVALVAVAQPADDLVHDALLFGLHAKASTTRGECIQLLQQLLPQILTQSQDFNESQAKRILATSEPIEELSSAQASQEDRQAETSRASRKIASGGPSRVKQMVRLARYAETLRNMAQEDPDANVARQAYEVGQIIPQFGSEIAHSLFADDRAPPKVRSAALKSILQRAPNQAAIAQMLPILSEWIANGPRGLVDAAMRAMVSLKEGGTLHAALAKGTMLSWQQACKLVETLEQNAHSVKRLLDQHQMDLVLESLSKAYTAQKREQTAAQDMGDIAEFAFCDALSGLGDSGFAFSASESWLDRFADSDVNLQVALATMLSDACVCSLEETIMGYIRSAETDKRLMFLESFVMLQKSHLSRDWLRAVKDTRMEPALAEAQADNVARMEGCIEDVLLSFDREPSELSAVVDLMRGSTMSKAIFMAMITLVRECPDQNVSARCRLALSQLKSPPPFQASDLLKLDTSGHESKLLWLTLLRKLRRNPAFTETISDAEVVIYVRSFVAPETAREYSPSTALLIIELLRCFTDLRITLESVDILNYLDVAATAFAEASDERILRILLQYLLVSENVRLNAAVVGHIIDLAGSESTDVTLETDRSRNIIHFFAQYQIKDTAETSSLLAVMEEHEVAASFLFEPVLSFLRRERTHRPSDEVHKSQAALRAQIDQLARTKRTLEATYLSKEIRFGFEMHDTLGVTSKQLALKGREKIKEQRVQRQALKDMREAEWEQARAEWFPPTLVDQHLEFINVPASLEYQQSRLSTASTGVFLNAIPDEMATERQIFAQNVLPEIRRRLRAMGVPVALHLSNPEVLGVEKPALANLEKVYAGEDSTDIRLKSRQEREKQAILSHPYAKSTNVRLSAPVKLQNSGHVSPNCLLDFFAQVTEDLLARILGEFPVRTSHRAKHSAGAVCGSEELAEELPFRLSEEQRAHEHFLWEHSQLLRSDTEFGGFLPRTRQHIYQDLQHLLTEDGSSDNKLRAERRTVKNPKFWTKDEHLGNSAILLTAERYQGKTTVLATFTDWYRSTCAPSLPPIIFHSCRASAMSGDLTLILLRLGVELLNVFHPRLDLEDWSPPCGCALNLESVRTWWHGLLCEVSSLALSDHRRPVLIIDGLFEVMDSASVKSKEIWMGLLPQRYGGRCPPGISMILSASACSNAKALARTNKRQNFPYRELQVGSLSKDEQTVLLTEALARYRMRPTESLLLRTSRAGANFAPANLDIFVRHVAGLHEGCTQVETSIEHLLGLLGNDELENGREGGGGNAPDGDAIVADRDRAHTILDSILIGLEVEFGVSLCRSILTCLALTGHMDESDLFEFSSQFAETISPKEWRRLCLQLDEVVICVSVCAQNEIAPWQRRGSSLRSVNSQSSRSSRGPEARRISDLASQDFSARRKSADGGAGRRYVRHVSAPEELMRTLHAEAHSLAEFYERLCRFWTSKLDVWYATSAQIPLLTHRAAVMRKVVHYALCASDPLSCIRRTLLSPKTLAAMAAQITWYDAMSAMAEDFARALDFLQQGLDSRFTEEDAKECAAKLAFARERISANVDEISANPDCVTELL